MNKETVIQQDIQKYLNENKIFNYRVNAAGNTVGLPDIMCCYRGHMVGLEVKTPEGKRSALQLRTQTELEKSGGFVFFPTSVADVKSALSWILWGSE